MPLINVVTFVVLKILEDLFHAKLFKMQTTADISEISKTVRRYLTFMLNVLSESSIYFA